MAGDSTPKNQSIGTPKQTGENSEAPWSAIQQFIESQNMTMMEMSKKMALQDAVLHALVKQTGGRVVYDESESEDEENGPVFDQDPTDPPITDPKEKPKTRKRVVLTTPKKDEKEENEDNKMMKAMMCKIEELNQEIRKIKTDHSSSTNSWKMTTLPAADFPAKFKMPNFTKFEGKSDPSIHVMIYESELGPYESNEALKVRLFDHSLAGNPRKWFANLDRSKMKWKDIHDAFMGQYSCLCQKAATKYDLEKLKKRPNESIRDFSTRWNEKKAEIVPPLNTSDLGELFVNALEPKYCGFLVGFIDLPFNKLVEKAEACEKFFESGRLRNPTAANELLDQIQTGIVSRKNMKKNEEEVSVVLPGMGTKKSWNSGASGSSSGANAKSNSGYVKTWVRDRKFTPLGDSYENILNILKEQKLITGSLPPPNHDPNARNFDAAKRCVFHSNAQGHSVENCWPLKHKIQDLIDSGDIVIQVEDAPNVEKNPFPKHAGVNMLSTKEETEGFQEIVPVADDDPRNWKLEPLPTRREC